jgi:hypothetical protein
MEPKEHVKIYSAGLVDVNGEFTVDDVKAIEVKVKSEVIKAVGRELNICLNSEHIQDETLQELIQLLERNSKLRTIVLDLSPGFKETITLQKNSNGQVEKYYKMHGLSHFTEFTPTSRTNFYWDLLRSASKRFQNLSMSRDINELTYQVDNDGHWHLIRILVGSSQATLQVSQALEDNDLPTLKKILSSDPADEFWRALEFNTHVTSVKCYVHTYFRTAREAFYDTMRHNKTLKELKFSWMNSDNDVNSMWFDALKENTTISHLHVRMYYKNITFITQVAEYLSHNTSLTHLYIRFDKAESHKAVYDSINTMQIQHLTLHYGSYNVADLVDFIINNKTIVSLNLIGFNVDLASAKLVLDALQQNETLILYNHRLSSKYKDPLQRITCDIGQIVRRNRKGREEYINDMTVLLFNIARSDAVLQSVPKEIWLQIFSTVSLTGFELKFQELLATLFQNNQIRKIVSCRNK